MFYVETQDGDLPYVKKVYETEKWAEKFARKFMAENHEAGMISLCTSTHETAINFFRDVYGPLFTIEWIDMETGDLLDTSHMNLK